MKTKTCLGMMLMLTVLAGMTACSNENEDNPVNNPESKAQTAYYYYKGQKMPLTLNEDCVCVSIPKTCESVCERIRANVQVLTTIKDDIYYIILISRSNLDKLTSQDFWKEDAKSVILSSCYFTENNKEVAESPYLNVRLKKEEDADLLDSYAEEYKLVNLGPFSQYQPLWYVLYVTPESEKSPLQCANELYESGDFASSVPDLVSLSSELLTVRSITTATPDASPEIYDLQGRRLSATPQKGMYIQNGKKKLMK